VKWHSPSKVHLTKEADIELPSSQHLEIGFNSSNAAPFQFYLLGDQTKEIGYFKVFFTRRSCPYLDDIAQDPIGELRGGSEASKLLKDPKQVIDRRWSTSIIEVVQRIK
jgi:hypothetical protein